MSWEIVYSYSGELKHHGVDGQKWGNKHGPPYPLNENKSVQARLKAASKSTYEKLFGKSSASKSSASKSSASKSSASKSSASKSSTVKAMNNDELKNATQRLLLETQYAQAKRQLSDAKKKSADSKSSASNTASKVRSAEELIANKVSARDMTAEELKSVNERLNLEVIYAEKMNKINPPKQSLSAVFGNKILYDAVIPAATTITRDAIINMAKRAEEQKK